MIEKLRDILADEVLAVSAEDTMMARMIRAGTDEETNNAIKISLAAMRRAYLLGRDDANCDADAAEQESIEQMEDDAMPSNPG